MQLRFPIPGALASGEIANFVKHVIEGAARGWVAPFQRANLPPLYETGVRFAYEPNHGDGNEEFANPFQVLARGLGDCDDLVIYRLCEIYAGGGKATCQAQWWGNAVHVRIRHADGTIEDPSVELGAPAP